MWTNLLALILCFTIISSSALGTTLYNGTQCIEDVCRLNHHKLRFFLIGDWGGQDTPPYVTKAQVTVARTMDKMGDERKAHCVLSVGDHFYMSGVQSVHSDRFQKSFDEVYSYGKAKRVPWYMVGGNHDHYGSVKAQMEYSRLNPRWIYPSLAYVVQYELTPSSTTIDFIVIDTVVLCGGTWPGGVNPRTGKIEPPRELPLGPEDLDKAQAMWSWVEIQLEKSRADYLFVVGHYPIFSTGAHGDFRCPGTRLLDLMERYNATAYLYGHDHNMQYLKSVGQDGAVVHHILSGGGNSLDKRRRRLNWPGVNVADLFFFPKPEEHIVPNADNVGGFVYAEIDSYNGSFWFYSGDGRMLYHVVVRPRIATNVSSKSERIYASAAQVSNRGASISAQLHYITTVTSAFDSFTKILLFSTVLFTLWLIGVFLIRRSLSRSYRTKELGSQSGSQGA